MALSSSLRSAISRWTLFVSFFFLRLSFVSDFEVNAFGREFRQLLADQLREELDFNV